jgi:hypothetical protein
MDLKGLKMRSPFLVACSAALFFGIGIALGLKVWAGGAILAHAWESAWVCKPITDCSPNWSAVEAIGTVLAFVIALFLPLYVRWDDRQLEDLRNRREGKGLALSMFFPMVEWERMLARLRRENDLVEYAISEEELIKVPREIEESLAKIGVLGPSADHLVAAVNASRLLTARSTMYSRGIRGDYDAVKNDKCREQVRSLLDTLYTSHAAAHRMMQALTSEKPPPLAARARFFVLRTMRLSSRPKKMVPGTTSDNA